ncbi:single-stranded DNA-binding protein [Noviherbaspirillum malthae]|uniref:single-stranded DNA-binding protein n=1 Tax=Noviherbaspirillum malthae TaxID=1260987 RepID=UPI00189066A7|nr:hypothetical protein [Noviherbaspirillum malthae]
MHVNKVIIVGNLGRDPETRYLPSSFERVLERVMASIATSKSRPPENILASTSDGMDAAAESNGANGVDGGGGEASGGSGNGDGDGDPDSDRRRAPSPTPAHSKRKTKLPPSRSGKSRKRSDPQSGNTFFHPSSSHPAHPERQRIHVQWM